VHSRFEAYPNDLPSPRITFTPRYPLRLTSPRAPWKTGGPMPGSTRVTGKPGVSQPSQIPIHSRGNSSRCDNVKSLRKMSKVRSTTITPLCSDPDSGMNACQIESNQTGEQKIEVGMRRAANGCHLRRPGVWSRLPEELPDANRIDERDSKKRSGSLRPRRRCET